MSEMESVMENCYLLLFLSLSPSPGRRLNCSTKTATLVLAVNDGADSVGPPEPIAAGATLFASFVLRRGAQGKEKVLRKKRKVLVISSFRFHLTSCKSEPFPAGKQFLTALPFPRRKAKTEVNNSRGRKKTYQWQWKREHDNSFTDPPSTSVHAGATPFVIVMGGWVWWRNTTGRVG